MSKPKSKPKNKSTSKIVDARCKITVSGDALLIKYKNDIYVTNLNWVEKLLDGTLKTKENKKQKSVSLGVFTDQGIDNDIDVWLTLKGKSVYFVPTNDEVLIAPVSNLQKLISGEIDKTRMGKFK